MRQQLAAIGVAICLAAGACNINVKAPLSQAEQNAAATIVAGTMQAANPTTGPFVKPELTITANSNCRSGPGGSYKLVTSFTSGTTLELVAMDSADNYWQVKIPNSEETCWIWGKYASAAGSIDTLPDAGPVVAAGSVPARPGSLFYQYACPFGSLTTTLTWTDAADNETGYHVYRFDILIADLPANSTSYTDVAMVDPFAALQYSVEAYNDAGAGPSRTVNFACK